MSINGNTKIQELVDALAHDDDSEKTDELTHWGVPGMRWGIRRYQNKDGTLTAAGKKRYDKELAALKEEQRILNNKKRTQAKIDKLAQMRKDIDDTKVELGEKPKTRKIKEKKSKTKAEEVPKRKLKELSDEELQTKINRLQLEKRYTELTTQPKEQKQVSKGKSFVGEIVTSSAKNVGGQLATFVMGWSVNRIAKAMGSSDPKIVNPKKGQKDK